MTENEIGKIVVDAAVKVHQALGPGLLESVYEIVLANKLRKVGCMLSGSYLFRSSMRELSSMRDFGRIWL